MAYLPSLHRNRSTCWQRSLQNGKVLDSVVAIADNSILQIGQDGSRTKKSFSG